MLSIGFAVNKKLVLVLFVIALIISLVIAIFFINSRSGTVSLSERSALNADLNSLETTLDKITSSKEKNDKEYTVIKELFKESLISTNIADKYKNFKAASDKVQLLYSLYNNSQLYGYINDDMDSFAKKYFPNQYEESAFDYPCQDQKCADSKQPVEILALIEEIKASDLPNEYKNNYVQNLLNTGYEPSADKHSKAWQYFATARSLKISSDLSPSGANLTIASKLREFIKKTYPEDYENLIRFENESSDISPNP